MATLLEIYYTRIACIVYETIKNINISLNKNFIKHKGIHRHSNALYSWADVIFKLLKTVVLKGMASKKSQNRFIDVIW